ncbi:MAG: hypothetical protein P4N41_17225 [Negativicutes bacterium]|nr:hypothetical protein [Negativicutes bacterium]
MSAEDLLTKVREFRRRIQELDLSPDEKAKMIEDYWSFISRVPLSETNED